MPAHTPAGETALSGTVWPHSSVSVLDVYTLQGQVREEWGGKGRVFMCATYMKDGMVTMKRDLCGEGGFESIAEVAWFGAASMALWIVCSDS